MSRRPADHSSPPAPAARPRRRTTRRSVKIIDKTAAAIITVGGIGVVVAFAAIVGFLCYVTLPLFQRASAEQAVADVLPAPRLDSEARPATVLAEETSEETPGAEEASGDEEAAPAVDVTGRDAAEPFAMAVDENLVALWVLDERGNLATYRLQGLELIDGTNLSDTPVTSARVSGDSVALGLEDGNVMVGRIAFPPPRYVHDHADELENLQPGETRMFEGGVAELTPNGIRVTRADPQMSEPLSVDTGNTKVPITHIDYYSNPRLETIVALRADGKLFYDLIRKQQNLMTGEETTRLEKFELPPSPVKQIGTGDDAPAAVLVGQNGRQVYVVYRDGHLTRYNTATPADARIAEETNLIDEMTEAGGIDEEETRPQITRVGMLNGGITLIVGDSAGNVSGWFAAPYPPDFRGRKNFDNERMVLAHRLRPHAEEADITDIAVSSRDRQFVTADERGRVVLRHMTSNAVQAELEVEKGGAVKLVDLSPKNDAILALDSDRKLSMWRVDNPHPDGTMGSVFLPVHYEGRAKAEHVWQSSSGTDATEPKFGLFPLVFGTFKATFYAMLFAVPVAILAAIYSSEFMQPRVRSTVKPIIELMAGLPSVVLGFLAALVLAPFVEQIIPATLLMFVAVPVGVMLFGFLWQLLSAQVSRAVPMWLPFIAMMAVVIGCVILSYLLGPLVERLLFYGNLRAWLDQRVGTGRLGATPGWMLLLSGPIAVLLVIGFNLYLRPRLRFFDSRYRSPLQLAGADLVRLVVITALTLGLAAAVGALLSAAGLDLRNDWQLWGMKFGPMQSYVQRNAFIVGVVMGFAIIPIIYTVSEDALSSVPQSLRSAAVGAGATPWQVAMRVVLPVGMSGVFSACMIGLGRAAGETMIVLMAAGNTPILDANLFSGLRTLSANIAVELPEAPVGSTHYRILFLSALVLFGITFLVNTAAEMVRLRFRRRAAQL